MRKIEIIMFLVAGVLTIACHTTNLIEENNPVTPMITPLPNVNSDPSRQIGSYIEIDSKKNEWDGNEITKCSPKTIYRGETLNISLKTPHGKYSAILRFDNKKWFFLYGGVGNNPDWTDTSFSQISEISINTETSFNSTNVEVGEKPEKIFTKTGKYRVLVSDEDFGQDDPIWTGMCEIYYINKKRPKNK